MYIQKDIHVHISSQKKRVEFSGINHCFFVRLWREDTLISVQRWPMNWDIGYMFFLLLTTS